MTTDVAAVHVKAPAQALEQTRAGWFLETPSGRHGPFRSVVLNAPARVGHQLLGRLSAFADLAGLLNTYEYFDSRLPIHTDPAYVHHDRSNWASYNAGVRGRQCEGYGALVWRVDGIGDYLACLRAPEGWWLGIRFGTSLSAGSRLPAGRIADRTRA